MMSWIVASGIKWSWRERFIITLAGIGPDLDGLGYIVDRITPYFGKETFVYARFHHIVCHNILYSIFAAVLCSLLVKQKRFISGILSFGVIHLHYLADLVGSKGIDGYQWPIPYFSPFNSEIQLTWSGQWELGGWQNVVISFCLMFVCFAIARSRGYSPFEILSQRFDRAVFAVMGKYLGKTNECKPKDPCS